MSYSFNNRGYSNNGQGGSVKTDTPTGIENMTNEQKDALRAQRNQGLRKMRTHGLVGLLLSVLAIAAGIAGIVVASDNIVFPTFNPGPIIVGVVFFVAGLLAWKASSSGLEESSRSIPSGGVKCYIIGHFVICVTLISIASVSAVFSLMAAGVCFDHDDVIANNRNGGKVNLSEACEPNKTGNAITGLVAGLVCLLIVLWSSLGTCFMCCYGRSFGFVDKRRRRVMMMERRIVELEARGGPGDQPPSYYAATHKY